MSTLFSYKLVPHSFNHHRRLRHHPQRHECCNIIRCCLPPQPTYSLSNPSRRSLLFLSTSLSLSLPSPPSSSSITDETPPPPSSSPPPPPPPPPPDTTITDRVYLDFSICPSYIRSQPQQQLCSDSEPMGRVVLGLYGKLVPITVSNFKTMCTSSAYKNTLIHKLLPGQFFVGGRQGRKDKGEVSPPLKLARNTDSVQSRAFLLKHSRPGVVSLCLSENDDDDDIKLDPDYHNVEFLITTGPGPCPQLDGRNIVFGSVLEGMDVVRSIAATPTYKPAERIKQLNDLASFFGDERASNARMSWDRPLKSVYISDCGELQVSKPSLSPSLP